jgi:hypothetical protein
MIGAYDAPPPELSTPEIDTLAGLRRQVMGLWEEGSDDVLTFRMALAYLKARQPRVLWLALGNSDDWAHADRYDRYLEYLHLVDSLLGELWDTVQSIDQYRDKTTLIITTDHGRGLQGSDWSEHDRSVPGSEDIWMAIVGPDTPDVGEVRRRFTTAVRWYCHRGRRCMSKVRNRRRHNGSQQAPSQHHAVAARP